MDVNQLKSENENLNKKNQELIQTINDLKNKQNKENENDDNNTEINLTETLQGQINDLYSKINEIELEKQSLSQELEKMKNKVNDYQTFEGKIDNYDELVKLFEILFNDYNPENNEQKEALDKLKKFLNK